jgi:AcrR family transcriptional regulator
MTLDRHFGSKDDLIVACLERAIREGEAVWGELEALYPDDKLAQLQGLVRRIANCVVSDTRGCDMSNVAVELSEIGHPARSMIEDFKAAQRSRLARLCKEAGVVQAELLADTLCLLIEGARVSRQSAGAEGPSARFVRMSEVIIASFARRDPARANGQVKGRERLGA